MRPIARRLRRAALVSVIVGTTLGVACSQRGIPNRACLICGLIGGATYEVARDERRAATSCGSCPSGQTCNTLYQPQRCAPSPGADGVRCGVSHGRFMRCADGYRCLRGACTPMPGEGQPCAYEHLRSEQGLSGAGFCGPGFVCGRDDLCRAGCPAPCPLFQVCSHLDRPPRCVSSTALAGRRCGRLDRIRHIDCLPLHVCVDRGAGGVCELAGAEGEACTTERCPPGFVCDRGAEECLPQPRAPGRSR
ncbi:MAG: hypothetical protein Q8S73_29180 [Deltaproteobacteria bacterium]|nr:hypothetical protein [Myxococcales bacterium]MDP3218215.1 hypothetical protein [Deltaproteobacteria bacterium]